MFFRLRLGLGLRPRIPQHELVNCSLGGVDKPLILRKNTEIVFSGNTKVMLNTRQAYSLKYYENTTKKNRKRILVKTFVDQHPLLRKMQLLWL
jgi:hypothetical protein